MIKLKGAVLTGGGVGMLGVKLNGSTIKAPLLPHVHDDDKAVPEIANVYP